jgi:hypothetical protein
MKPLNLLKLLNLLQIRIKMKTKQWFIGIPLYMTRMTKYTFFFSFLLSPPKCVILLLFNSFYLFHSFAHRIGFDPVSNTAQLQVVDECSNRLPKKEIMHTSGVFVVDTCSEVFCWTGKASGARQRKHGLRIALVLTFYFIFIFYLYILYLLLTFVCRVSQRIESM